MVFVSCLGTTKAQAGSIEAQRKIDLDLNLQLATAAREEGMETVSENDGEKRGGVWRRCGKREEREGREEV